MTLVQCRPLWVWHITGLLMCAPTILLPLGNPEYRPGALIIMLIVPLWNGVMSASVCRDFLSKPFSFGLPRHAPVWRRALFTLGLVVAGACSLVFLLVHSGTPVVFVVSICLSMLLYMAVFMLGVLVIIKISNPGFLPGVMTLLLFILYSDSFGDRFRVTAEQALLANPLLTIAASAFIVAGTWRKLGSRTLSRKRCGEPFLPIHSVWSGDKQADYKAQRKLSQLGKSPGAIMGSVERFFLTRMSAAFGHPTTRSLWGSLYVASGKAAPAKSFHMITTVLGLALLTVVLGFYHPERLPAGVSGANLMMFLLIAFNAEYRFNPYAALLLNISRKNRFRSLMLAALVQAVATLAAAAVAALVSVAAGRFLHEIAFLGQTWTYHPIVLRTILFFLPMLPLFFVCQLLFRNHPIIPITVVSIIAVIIVLANFQGLLGMPLRGLLLLQLVSWLPFIALTRQYCFFWDLRLDGK
jgi:hypothetical protein